MFHGLSNETQIGQALTTDDAIPIIDLDNQEGAQGACSPNLDATSVSNRMSGSSFTMSTPGAMSDVPAYEDFSTAFSDVHSFCSDYPPPSNRTSWMSSTHLSPVASPRIAPQSRPELVRTQSRGRASPSPRPGMRSAPYSIDGSRSKRWSTGSYAPGRRASPYVSSMGPENFMPQQRKYILFNISLKSKTNIAQQRPSRRSSWLARPRICRGTACFCRHSCLRSYLRSPSQPTLAPLTGTHRYFHRGYLNS